MANPFEEENPWADDVPASSSGPVREDSSSMSIGNGEIRKSNVVGAVTAAGMGIPDKPLVTPEPDWEQDSGRNADPAPFAAAESEEDENPFVSNLSPVFSASSKLTMATDGTNVPPGNNWPICCPFSRIAISTDIPQPQRFPAILAYFVLLGTVASVCANFIAAAAIMTDPKRPGDSDIGKPIGWLFIALYLVLGPVFAWMWFRYLYSALEAPAADGTPRGLCCFLFLFFIHLLFLATGALGFPGTHLSGAITMAEIAQTWAKPKDHHTDIHVILAAITTGLFGTTLILAIWLFGVSWNRYRGQGQQGLRQMQGEAKSRAGQAAWEAAASNPSATASLLANAQ